MMRLERVWLFTAMLLAACEGPLDLDWHALGRAHDRARDPERTGLKVTTFNIWGGGANEGRPVDETVAAIEAEGADIIGVEETRFGLPQPPILSWPLTSFPTIA